METTPPRRIAWIGLGVMGLPMAGHLLSQGHQLTVHTRTRAKAAPLIERGARWAESPAAAADVADVAISMVSVPADVEATHLGPAGTLAAGRRPRLLIDMTTSRPALARRIHAEAMPLGVTSLDAPVSGGDIGARNATLSIMVGGDAEAFEQALPLLRAMGRTIVHQGGPGAGQHTKMVNQILIASHMMGACEGLLYAAQAGLDATRVIESVGSGAAGSWAINNLGPRMIRRDFEPGFFVEHFIKDLSIALDEAASLGIALPGLALARQLYEAVRAQGLGRAGTQALLLALERFNGLEVPGETRGAPPPSRL